MVQLDAPLYESEFGHGVDLHDACITGITVGSASGMPATIWNLSLFSRPAVGGGEKSYRYDIAFLHSTSIPDGVLGYEIYRDFMEPLDEGWLVTFILMPDGREITFQCSGVVEISLKPDV